MEHCNSNPRRVDHTGMTCDSCYVCLTAAWDGQGWHPAATRMILCAECGNKRCPKANDCANTCTGSNEPGQIGSAYEFATPAVETNE